MPINRTWQVHRLQSVWKSNIHSSNWQSFEPLLTTFWIMIKLFEPFEPYTRLFSWLPHPVLALRLLLWLHYCLNMKKWIYKFAEVILVIHSAVHIFKQHIKSQSSHRNDVEQCLTVEKSRRHFELQSIVDTSTNIKSYLLMWSTNILSTEWNDDFDKIR